MNHLQTQTTKLKDNLARGRPKLNAMICKTLKANNKSEASMTVSQNDFKEVNKCTNLGVNMTKDGGSTADIKKQLSNIWQTTDGRKTKAFLFKSLVLSALLHGCKTWYLTKGEEEKFDVFQTKCLRSVFKN